MITIRESGVEFGPFPENSLFRVEKSSFVASLPGIKACEFAWWTAEHKQLIFVEAKTTVPNSSGSPAEFEAYFVSMLEKFDNSLQLLLGGTKGRPVELAAELGADLAQLDWQSANILFFLVIPSAPKRFLSGLTDKLRVTLSRQLKIWQANAFVINEQMAKSKGLVAAA